MKIAFLVEANGGERVEAEAAAGEKLTQVAYRAGVLITQTCGGKAACTDCRVLVKDGVDDGFEPPTGAEVRQLGNIYFITRERLACQAIVKGDSTVWVPHKTKQKTRR